jgi:hypothetical protein
MAAMEVITGNPLYRWSFIAGKIIEINGGFSSQPGLIIGGYL